MRTRLNPEPLEDRTLPAAPFQSLPVLPFTDAAVLDHARAVVARGQQLGRRLDTFVRLGDSNSSVYGIGGTTVAPFLNPLGADSYNPYASGLAASNPHLLDTWWTYTTAVNAAGQDSFSWIGPGASGGFGSVQVLAGLGTDVAVANPGIALVMVGTNEIPWPADAAGYRSRLTQIVSSLVARGILPVLSTIPPYQFAGNAFQYRVAQINQVVADVAAAARVPLWNFWRSAVGLPFQGIVQDADQIHYNVSPSGGGSFGAFDLLFAQNLRNLQALKILDWFRETVANPAPTHVAPRANWRPLEAGRALYSVGRDAGLSPTVDVIDAAAGRLVNRFLAFGPSFGGGVRVATGDVNGDGFADVVCGTASGVGVVKVFSGRDGSVLARLAPFVGVARGVSVAAGDVTGDGVADVVVGRAAEGSVVRVYAGGTFKPVAAFRAFSAAYTGGVSVAVADVAGTGPVVAVGAAAGVPVVGLFGAAGSRVSARQVYGGTGFGVSVAAADLDGDGNDELAVAPVGGSRSVRVVNPVTWRVRATFTARPVVDPAWGLRLSTLHSDGADTLLVGNGPGSRTVVLGFTGLGGVAAKLKPDADRAYGIFVG